MKHDFERMSFKELTTDIWALVGLGIGAIGGLLLLLFFMLWGYQV